MNIERCEVLVIGSGGAGLRCAIELADHGVDVVVVGKCKKGDAHTVMATGGINAALGTMDPKDSWQLHAADTLRDGGFINDPVGVEILCKNAKGAINELVNYGAKFHREKDGRISQRFFGAATYRRACFIGDYTGREILNTLVKQVDKRKIKFVSEVYIVKLLSNKGAVCGAVGLDLKKGTFRIFEAKKVVLCTGGHSRVFSNSSSRFWENTGDGIGLASELSATCMDMEFFQFHPTGMVWPKAAAGILVTEAVRGEGGILTNVKGERFMKRYDPKRMELSARDIVSQAIYSEIKAGRGTKRGGVYLDISHKPKSYILKRLPQMYAQFKKYCKLDISKQKMEVTPTAHYAMGGLCIDHKTGKTTVPNLYAIGEVTSGMHGGNRLGGNSLLELIVFGRRTGQNIARAVKAERKTVRSTFSLAKNVVPAAKVAKMYEKAVPAAKMIKRGNKLNRDNIANQIKEAEQSVNYLLTKKGKDPIKVKEQLQKIMWKSVGVVRNRRDMLKGLKDLYHLQSEPLAAGSSKTMNKKLIAALDLKMMFPTCEMIIKSAIKRKESRRAHFRSDYPKESKQWKMNIISQVTNKGIYTGLHRISSIPKEIRRYLGQERRERLLE